MCASGRLFFLYRDSVELQGSIPFSVDRTPRWRRSLFGLSCIAPLAGGMCQFLPGLGVDRMRMVALYYIIRGIFQYGIWDLVRNYAVKEIKLRIKNKGGGVSVQQFIN